MDAHTFWEKEVTIPALAVLAGGAVSQILHWHAFLKTAQRAWNHARHETPSKSVVQLPKTICRGLAMAASHRKAGFVKRPCS